MPGPLESFQSFRYDPAAASWHWTENPTLTLDLENPENGSGFFSSGSSIYRSADSSLVGRFSRQLGSQLTIGTEGSVFLTNAVRGRELQRFANPNAVYSALVSADLPGGPEGEIVTKEGFISLTPRGGAIYTTEATPQSKAAFQKFLVAPFQKAGAPESLGNYRLASPAELLERGLIGWLVRNAQEELNRIAVQGGESLGLGPNASLYEIARAIAKNITVTPAVTYFIQPGLR